MAPAIVTKDDADTVHTVGKKASKEPTADSLKKSLKNSLQVEGKSEKEIESFKACESLNAKAIKSHQATHEAIMAAAMADLEHFKKFGDARPIDRLVKGLINEGGADVQPLIFWVKSNSPIYWELDSTTKMPANVKVQPKQKSDGSDNEKYVPLDLKKAEAVPYFATPEAKARGTTEIKPLTAMYFIEKFDNTKRQFENSLKPDSKRPFDASYGGKNLVEDYLASVEEVTRRFRRMAENAYESSKKRGKKAAPAGKKITKPAAKRTTAEGAAVH